MSINLQSYGWYIIKNFLGNPENEIGVAVSRLHIYLHKAEDHAVEESGYEEEYEGGGHGPQAADLIFLQGITYAVQHCKPIWVSGNIYEDGRKGD